MKKNQITLPADLYASLQQKTLHLAIDINALVAGLVKNFLSAAPSASHEQTTADYSSVEDAASTAEYFSKPKTKNGTAPDINDNAGEYLTKENRQYKRLKVNQSAMLFFRAENGRSARYNSVGLKEVARGGVLLEYHKNRYIDSDIAPGKQCELIFQLRDNEPPLHMQCEICRVSKDMEKTSLGAIFIGNNKSLSVETMKILAKNRKAARA